MVDYFKIREEILKAQSFDKIDAITGRLDKKTLRTLIKLLVILIK